MGLIEFFERAGKENPGVEAAAKGLHEAVIESGHDEAIFRRLKELVKHLRSIIEGKLKVKENLEILVNKGEIAGIKEQVASLNKLKKEVIVFRKESESRNAQMIGIFHAEKITKKIDEILKNFMELSSILSQNQEFFEQFREYADEGYINDIKSRISASEGLIRDFDKKIRLLEDALREEHDIFLRLLSIALQQQKDLRTYQQRMRDCLKEIEENLDSQYKLAGLLEAEVSRMMGLTGAIYKLFYSMGGILKEKYKFSRALGHLYYPVNDPAGSMNNAQNWIQSEKLAKSLDRANNSRFKKLKQAVSPSKADTTDLIEIVKKMGRTILNSGLNKTTLQRYITDLENFYVNKSEDKGPIHHNYIDVYQLRFHYSRFLNKPAGDVALETLRYYEGIAIYWFLTCPENIYFLTTPGNILHKQTGIKGRMPINFLWLALDLYCREKDVIREISGSRVS